MRPALLLVVLAACAGCEKPPEKKILGLWRAQEGEDKGLYLSKGRAKKISFLRDGTLIAEEKDVYDRLHEKSYRYQVLTEDRLKIVEELVRFHFSDKDTLFLGETDESYGTTYYRLAKGK